MSSRPCPASSRACGHLCDEGGILLIFDEVISGFRAAKGGAQAAYGVRPDLTCLGKIIGGGLPVGAYGGRADLMAQVAPAGPVYQAGTLAGNPLAMTAGIWALSNLSATLYRRLAALGARLADGLRDAAREAGVPLTVNVAGSVLTPVLQRGSRGRLRPPPRPRIPPRTPPSSAACCSAGSTPRRPSSRGWFLSAAHSEQDVDRTIRAAGRALAEVRGDAS